MPFKLKLVAFPEQTFELPFMLPGVPNVITETLKALTGPSHNGLLVLAGYTCIIPPVAFEGTLTVI